MLRNNHKCRPRRPPIIDRNNRRLGAHGAYNNAKLAHAGHYRNYQRQHQDSVANKPDDYLVEHKARKARKLPGPKDRVRTIWDDDPIKNL